MVRAVLHFTVFNFQAGYVRKRLNIRRMLSLSVSRTKNLKGQLHHGGSGSGQDERVHDGITCVGQIIAPEEMRENFRMSRDSLYSLTHAL